MKTRKELHDAAKKIRCPQAAIDSISVTYSHIENLLCHPYLASRSETLSILDFHLKHLAFLVTQDESKFSVLAEIQFRVSLAASIYKGIFTKHDFLRFQIMSTKNISSLSQKPAWKRFANENQR